MLAKKGMGIFKFLSAFFCVEMVEPIIAQPPVFSLHAAYLCGRLGVGAVLSILCLKKIKSDTFKKFLQRRSPHTSYFLPVEPITFW